MTILDVSHYQGNVDYSKVATTNNPKIEGVYIKATQGVGYIDPLLRRNAEVANEFKIPIGYYHYASINSSDIVKDAESEANYFLMVIGTLPTYQLPLVLDIEENKAHLSPNEILLWINTFFAVLGDRDYMLYSYTPFLDQNLPAHHVLGSIKLWIAQYTNKPQPKLPHGWDKYYLWQYTAKGKVPGITGDVDMNKAFNLKSTN